MKVILALVLVLALAMGCGASNAMTVNEADYDNAWPLTIPEATLICEPVDAVFLEVDGLYYGGNGFGSMYIKREHPLAHRDLESIWRPDPRGINPRMNISPLLDGGLKLCK